MAERLVLHIGSMKSGTSFVQNVLGHNKERLAEAGVLFPGRRWRDQVDAVRDLISFSGPETPLADDGPWRTLARQIETWSGTAVVSMEFLGPRTRVQIEEILRTFPGTRVEVVMTCRDLARNIPAMWLESMQNGATTTWQDYLDAVRRRDRKSPAGRNFWRHQDIPAIATRWAGAVGRDRFTLVTVPPKGAPSDLLWRRFCEVLGIEAADYDLDVRANPSIGLATALVLRQLNERVSVDGKPPAGYDRLVKHTLAKRGLVARQADEPRLGLDERWVTKAGKRLLADLRDAGFRVIGDLDELTPLPVPGVHADQVTAEQQLAASVDGLAFMFQAWQESERTHRRKLRRARRGQPVDA